ncbi:ubiquitin-like protein [Amniculicola lignicola CBS 123094]|uniref:Ubiquitin-like modifier HUB1 n=1 Tax=Amniculicola lignicola CBS 123094 TaxID=1392246 RepID=A0A6A5X502_9PLEO|nr:ubiquitin-like protein [Amniculicola lignicola CBS 123094]
MPDEETPRARSRSPRRSRSPPPRRRSRSPRRERRGGFKWKDNQRPREDRDRDRDRDSGRGYSDRGRGYSDRNRGPSDRDRDPSDRNRGREDRAPKDREPRERPAAAKPVVAAGSGEPMIIVTVNDRLGTKAQIPCLASDPVKVFKAMVAAKIGRGVHEIMLKRQGERPFKDNLTLEDYGVSNGVQLDLELDTGD